MCIVFLWVNDNVKEISVTSAARTHAATGKRHCANTLWANVAPAAWFLKGLGTSPKRSPVSPRGTTKDPTGLGGSVIV